MMPSWSPRLPPKSAAGVEAGRRSRKSASESFISTTPSNRTLDRQLAANSARSENWCATRSIRDKRSLAFGTNALSRAIGRSRHLLHFLAAITCIGCMATAAVAREVIDSAGLTEAQTDRLLERAR